MNSKIIIFFILLIISCGEKKRAVESNQDEIDDALEYMYRDSTIYGSCGEGSAMNTLQLITDNGDTLWLSTMIAQEGHQIYGGYTIGDRMAVLSNHDLSQAELVVNLSALMGDWVTPNPMDGSSYMGFTIKDGGILENINQSSVIYKTWQIENGRFKIVSIREGGGDFTETEIYNFRSLTKDSLVLEGGEDIYEYSRPGQVEDYNDIELDEEEEDFEDLVI